MKLTHLLSIVVFVFVWYSCQPHKRHQNLATTKQLLDLQGHRGARGLYPENSLPGFEEAMKWGVTTLELDLCVSADSQLVVSHEPWMNSKICQDPDGHSIPVSAQHDLNIYRMTYEEIHQYDCGSRGHPRFPKQKEVSTYKPTWREVVLRMDSLAHILGRPLPLYNIEIKRIPKYDGKYHPDAKTFSTLVMNEINAMGIAHRTTVQSFDVETINYFIHHYPKQSIAYLVESGHDWSQKMTLLDGLPSIYSPHYSLVDVHMVNDLHALDISVIPWTVNNPKKMKKLIRMGVDGLISDYPDRMMSLFSTRKDGRSSE